MQGVISAPAVAALLVAWGAFACTSSPAGPGAPPSPAPGPDAAAPPPAPPAPPSLAALSVTAAAPSTMALVPAFSPSIHDYYVRCAAGTNQLELAMTAGPGAEGELRAPSRSPPSASQSFTLSVSEGQAVVVAAVAGQASTEYWVRCLPHDVPALSWSLTPGAPPPTPGYYLLGNLFPPTGADAYAMVIDGNGVPVWYTRADPGFGVFDVDSLASGSVSFIQSTGATTKTYPSFEVHHVGSVTTTSIGPHGVQPNFHELRPLPNGNYLAFFEPTVTGVDLTGLQAMLPNGGTQALGANEAIQECGVVEFRPDGAVVSTWRASEHFDPALDSTFPEIEDTGPGRPPVVAVFHCNSIDVDPANGNILVSARNMDSVFYVERPSGKVLWKMGGSTQSKDGATYVKVVDPFFRAHDARLAPGWSQACRGGTGQLSIYDDQTSAPGKARAVVYDVVVGGSAGTGGSSCPSPAAPGSAKVAWETRGISSAIVAGSFRTLADGSRVVGWGLTAERGPALSEIAADGTHIADLYLTAQSSYRAIKVPVTTFDLGALRASAGR